MKPIQFVQYPLPQGGDLLTALGGLQDTVNQSLKDIDCSLVGMSPLTVAVQPTIANPNGITNAVVVIMAFQMNTEQAVEQLAALYKKAEQVSGIRRV